MENINQNTLPLIAQEEFEFASQGNDIHDLKFDTKPIGYLKDAWIRFKKSKVSIAGAIVILLIIIYAIVTPIISGHSGSQTDGRYQKMVPFIPGTSLVDGTYSKECNPKSYLNLTGLGMAAEDKTGEIDFTTYTVDEIEGFEFNPIRKVNKEVMSTGTLLKQCRVQSYYEIGFYNLQVSSTQYDEIKAYEAENNLQILYPIIDTNNVPEQFRGNATAANWWYKVDKQAYPVNEYGVRIETVEGMKNVARNYVYDDEGHPKFFSVAASGGDKIVRVFYWNYYRYLNNGKLPSYILGTDDLGRDIAVRLASGIGLSLILGFSTFILNFVIGAIYGAIEGYFGGIADLIMERVSDILNDIPFIVLASIVNIKLIETGKMSAFGAVLFAFVLTGWLSPAYLVRTQFYRFKNQEYVLAARTLGAGNARIMFKHIFPNTLGTIVTSTVLMIPSTIFTESSLSYLGIINLNQGGITSLGTMLATGQAYMTTFPHIIVPPCIIISLLMISFNLFGNGLRDAFNPSLRGVEE